MNIRQIRREAKLIIKDAISDLKRPDNLTEAWDGRPVYAVYIGTVFSVMPSGKYYMPWACSNIEKCNRCKGKGCKFCGYLGSREAWEDQVMSEALDKYAGKYNAWVESSEGSATDLFLVMDAED